MDFSSRFDRSNIDRRLLCSSVLFCCVIRVSAVEKFARASSAGGRLHLQTYFRKSDRVGRRGLSEPRANFSTASPLTRAHSLARLRGDLKDP